MRTIYNYPEDATPEELTDRLDRYAAEQAVTVTNTPNRYPNPCGAGCGCGPGCGCARCAPMAGRSYNRSAYQSDTYGQDAYDLVPYQSAAYMAGMGRGVRNVRPLRVDGSLPTMGPLEARRRRIATRMVSPVSALMGQTETTERQQLTNLGVSLSVLTVGMLAAVGTMSYFAGKAMAPSSAKAKRWGWIGVPVGLIGGPIGLGVMGLVSLK